MAHKPLPPIELLRQLFRYDAESGHLYWLPRSEDMFEDKKVGKKLICKLWNKKYANKICSPKRSIDKVTFIFGNSYRYNRIVYAVANGCDPGELIVDHISGNTFDNSASNLEAISLSQNQKRRKGQTSGRAKRDMLHLSALKKRLEGD